MTLNLPASASFGLDAQTNYGKVVSRFALAQTETAGDTHLVGSVGEKPEVFVTISASLADVVVQPAK